MSTPAMTSAMFTTLGRASVLLPIYLPALFMSALLMFWVQPLIGKMILPLLGGTPMVWATCMVFFQALLLAGYAYAHVTYRNLGVRRQAALHLALVALSLFALPVGFGSQWAPPTDGSPIGWLFLLLFAAVGAPFFVLSATAPMLQAWFSRSDHPAAHDPYFLYVTSNLGSLVGLVAFPLGLELFLTIPQQTWTWTAGYVGFAALIALAAATLRNGRAGSAPAATPSPAAGPTATLVPDVWLRLRWLLLAFAPSSLLLGLTLFVTTDVAAVPMLWIVPLAAYLVTFMVAFARRPAIPHAIAVRVQPFLVLPVVFLFFWGATEASLWVMALHLAAFFVTALVCHGELARLRPDPAHLTEFYLLLSLGGVLGGAFNALVAPQIFTSLAEYPLVILLALLLRPPAQEKSPRAFGLDGLVPVALFAALWVANRSFDVALYDMESRAAQVINLIAVLVCFATYARPIRFGLSTAAVLAAGWLVYESETTVFVDRNFFGQIKVVRDDTTRMQILTHGTTNHGGQSMDPARRLEPLTYYVQGSPLRQVFDLPALQAKDARVAVLGLGAGTIACVAGPGQHVTFYEIDPAVVRVARDPQFFTFLSDCPSNKDVVLGDGRLTLAGAPEKNYALIVADAFTSDAVPVHLLTREALAMYLSKTKDDGAIVYNISNRYLDLAPVLGGIAADAGLVAFVQHFYRPEPVDEAGADSSWVVMTRPGPTADALARNPRWEKIGPAPGTRLWTDDYSNILSVFRW